MKPTHAEEPAGLSVRDGQQQELDYSVTCFLFFKAGTMMEQHYHHQQDSTLSFSTNWLTALKCASVRGPDSS
jgi:oxalate decarboxylase/phosphoglucose isomerase-like protein (cupin superfamily)